MGLLGAMVWTFFGVIIIGIYGILLVRRVSNGFHIWGKPIQQEKYLAVKKQYKMVLYFLIFLVVVVPFIIPTPKEDPNAWKKTNNSSMAYAMMQQFVKENLVSPGSAKFEWITEPDCQIGKDGFDYLISSWVDSQNRFGATIRTRFWGTVRQVDKDNWQLVDLEFEE